MLIEEIYHKNPKTINENLTVRKALKEMLKHKYNGMIVVNDSGKVVGVLSLQDVAGATVPRQFRENIEMASAMYTPGFFGEMVRSIQDKKIKRFMRRNVLMAELTTPIMVAAAEFLNGDLYIVPVMQDKKLIGLVTRSEIKHALAKEMKLESLISKD